MEPAEDPLVSLGLDFATATVESVEVWLRQQQQQQRTLQGLPSPLASALFRRLQLRRLLFPSLLEIFVECLEDVDLSGEVDVDAEWMAYLGGFRHLWSLNLADCQALTDSALRALSGMTTLKDLDLSRCYKISDAGIRHLLLNTSLEKLSVSGTKLTEDGIITCFKSFGYLRFLDLSRLRVTDRALSSLEVLKYLEHLNLQGSSVTNKGVVYLKSLSKLSSLDVSFTSVNGLPFLSSLIYLNMNDCLINKVFNEGGKCLAPLATLLLSRTIFKNESEAFSCIQPDLVTYLDLSKSYVSQFHFLADMR